MTPQPPKKLALYGDEYYMRLALDEARKAYEVGEVPIGAVLVWQDKVIARAHNQVETLADPTAHAEVLAISSAASSLGSKYLVQCRLYVTIEPCPMCAGAIRWARVGEVIYGAGEDKFGYTQFAASIVPRGCQVRSGVLADEARALMQRFFAERRG